MTQKYETRCWLCSSLDLEPDSRGIRCRSCGATFNLVTKPGQDPITLRKDTALDAPSASPSYPIVKAAAKVRGNSIH